MRCIKQPTTRKFSHFWSEQVLRAGSIDANEASSQSPGNTVEIILLGVFLGLTLLINNDGME